MLWLILRWKLAPRYRDWAERASNRRIVQAIVFSPLLILTLDILRIPADAYDQSISRRYGLSVQGWGSWVSEWVKMEAIAVIVGTILIAILYAVIRWSPRRWWLCFWIVSIPIVLGGVFLQPMVIDPLFHKFASLEAKDPALTAALEQMTRRAGEPIAPARMYWMEASDKSTTLGAYVAGMGESKRMVVFDTTIAKLNTPEVVFVAAHETGHYVLDHIPKIIGCYAATFFVIFYLGYLFAGWTVTRWGAGWEIRGLDDLASLPVLLIVLAVLTFVLNPVTSGFTRHFEHQADQFGLEATHGLTPDSGQVAAQAFQIDGDAELADPAPNPVDLFLFYDHPRIPDRIRFALSYAPWSHGGHGEFVP